MAVIITAVYVPPSANAKLDLLDLHNATDK